MENEPLKAVSNVIELKPDKRYLLVFTGVPAEVAMHASRYLHMIGIEASTITLDEGQTLQVFEQTEVKSDAAD